MGSAILWDDDELNPQTMASQGGGWSDILRAAMLQQGQAQPAEDVSGTSNKPELNLDAPDAPRNALISRLRALQTSQNQYQPISGGGGQSPFTPPNPNFRQVSRTPITILAENASTPPASPEDQSSPTASPASNDSTVKPSRSLAEHLQAYWEHPDPRGLVAMFKNASDGMKQAVQGSIDATTTPMTEEDAFRQNLGRELGPVGAFRALSLQSPVSPASGASLGNALVARAIGSAIAGINPLSAKPGVQRR